MNSKDKYLSVGRIRYIEPTILGNHEGDISDSIMYPYEDYNMAIDLSIMVADRFSCGFACENNEYTTLNYSSEKGTISFLGGSKVGEADGGNFLTTSYTDITHTQPKYNTSECLGIESINITYSSWMYPEVVIKFVDVRGGTVMGQAEQEYYNPDDRGMAHALYKALFSFPYPCFTLRTKGFYGRGATYKLVPEKVDMDFNSTTGNFDITVRFIGFMYGIYTDMPMTYLVAAPYTDDGADYWKQNISSGKFKFKDADGNDVAPMLTFPELRYKLGIVAQNQAAVESIHSSSLGLFYKSEQLAVLKQIRSTFPFGEDSGWFYAEEDDGYIYCLKPSSNDANADKKITDPLKDFQTAVKQYADSYQGNGTKFTDTLYGLMEMKFNVITPLGRIEKLSFLFKRDGSVAYLSFADKRLGKNVESNLVRYARQNNLKNVTLYRFKRGNGDSGDYADYINFVKNYIDPLIDECEKEVNTESMKLKAAKEEAITSALGFRPSIQNLYNLAFAHMDTFMHCFYRKLGKIKAQLDSGTNRLKSTYKIKDGDTDTENLRATSSNSYKLPPFAAYYTVNTEVNSNGSVSEKKQLRWPGDLPNGDKLVEVEFVKEILSAAQEYSRKEKNVEEFLQSIAEEKSSIDPLNLINGTPTCLVNDFIPLTSYDIINKDYTRNPYSRIATLINDGEESIAGSVLSIFAMRAYYYLAANGTQENDKQAEAFGTIDAINLFKAIGDRTSDNFYEFIKKYADGSDKKSDINEFFNAITEEATDGNPISKYWNFNAPNTEKKMFTEKYGQITYTLYKGKKGSDDEYNRFLPIASQCLSTIKEDYTLGDDELYKKDGYLSLRDYDEKYSSDSAAVSTFRCYESKDFLEALLQQIESECDNATKNFGAETGDSGSGRNEGEYGRMVRKNRTLKNLRNSVNDELEESSTLTNSTYPEKIFKEITVNKHGKLFYETPTKEAVRHRIENGRIEEAREGKRKKGDFMGVPTAARFIHGKITEAGDLFIQNPSVVNENNRKSIFENGVEGDIYNLNNHSKKAQAYLFLQTVPISGEFNAGIALNAENGTILKSKLLREGSFYWREDNMDEVKVPEGYKVPESGETFMGVLSEFFATNHTGYSFNTLNVIKMGKYVSYKYPKGTTPSRRACVKELFEKWATEEYPKLEQMLMDKGLYFIPLLNQENETGLDYNICYNPKHPKFMLAQELQVELRKLFFGVYTTMDYYAGIGGCEGYDDSNHPLSHFRVSSHDMKNAFRAFMRELKKVYKRTAKSSDEELAERAKKYELNDPFKNTDLRLATYMTLKNLYDKFICSSDRGQDAWTFASGKKCDFNNFNYIDSYYHRLGYRLTANATKVGEWVHNSLPSGGLPNADGAMQYMSRSIYEYLYDMAVDCGGMLLALPQSMGLSTAQQVVDMFKPISINDGWNEETTCFMFIYTYKPSEHLGSVDSGSRDMNGYDPNGDSFLMTTGDIIGSLCDTDGDEIPAFGVTYAKQNQSIFKSISLNTEGMGTTEASLAATFDIANKASEGARETTLYGQDLYRVYNQYAYYCEVEAMGNMQIMPTMYFQLNNIPMWKGTYMVQKVTHDFSLGNCTTKFTGVRLNKYAIPLSDALIIANSDNGIGGNGDAPDSGATSEEATSNDTANNITGNGQPVKETETTVNPDFLESNISKSKPVICLTPAHGPQTQKAFEWEWSSKLIDEGIIPELKKKKFSDGTDYASNLQRCNQDGKNTGRGYSMRQTRDLIKKYGSDKVISLVPHWNGGAGARYGAYTGTKYDEVYNGTSAVKSGALKGQIVKVHDPAKSGDKSARSDSFRFGECVIEQAKKVKDARSTYKIPAGMMDGKIENLKLAEHYALNNSGEFVETTDGACSLDCACVLGETWFGDYPSTERYISVSRAAKLEKDSATGNYQFGTGWLFSDEGIKVIGKMYADAIESYIKTLS